MTTAKRSRRRERTMCDLHKIVTENGVTFTVQQNLISFDNHRCNTQCTPNKQCRNDSILTRVIFANSIKWYLSFFYQQFQSSTTSMCSHIDLQTYALVNPVTVIFSLQGHACRQPTMDRFIGVNSSCHFTFWVWTVQQTNNIYWCNWPP